MLTKQETSLGRGPGREQRGEGPGRTARGPGFMVRGFLSGRLWPIVLTQGPSWGGPSPLSQHGFQQGGFWEDTWTGESSLLTFPDSSGW